ncbi:MAG: SixA phosphatase family protein [Ectothiorhodospira sp.]
MTCPKTLILVRHSQAGDADAFARTGQEDHLRPLTPRGVARMDEAALGLASLLKGEVTLLTSPYVRARQTTEILARALPTRAVKESPELVPEADPARQMAWMRGLGKELPPNVILVGHEPNLSLLAGWLLTGRHHAPVRMKKGGACALTLEKDCREGRAVLQWLLTQRQLRLIQPH